MDKQEIIKLYLGDLHNINLIQGSEARNNRISRLTHELELTKSLNLINIEQKVKESDWTPENKEKFIAMLKEITKEL